MKSSLDAPLSSMKHFWPYWWRARAVSLLTCAAFFPLRWHDSPQSNTFKPYFSESFLFAPEKMWCSSIKPYLPHSQHRPYFTGSPASNPNQVSVRRYSGPYPVQQFWGKADTNIPSDVFRTYSLGQFLPLVFSPEQQTFRAWMSEPFQWKSGKSQIWSLRETILPTFWLYPYIPHIFVILFVSSIWRSDGCPADCQQDVRLT